MQRCSEYEEAWEKDGEGADFRFDRSYAVVCKVKHHDTMLWVSCEPVPPFHAGQLPPRTVTAARVVVTARLPILRDELRFAPPLSEAKVRALQSIRMANGAKVLFLFCRPVWPADMHGAVCSDSFCPEMWVQAPYGTGQLEDVDGTIVDPNSIRLSPAGRGLAAPAAQVPSAGVPASEVDETNLYLLTGYFMADRADAVAAMPDAVVVARMLSQLQEMFHTNVSGALIPPVCLIICLDGHDMATYPALPCCHSGATHVAVDSGSPTYRYELYTTSSALPLH